MPVEMIESHPDIACNIGRMALQRGPIVYCLEQVDHAMPIARIVVPENAKLSAQHVPDLLDGVTVLQGQAQAATTQDWNGELYRPIIKQQIDTTTEIFAVPYFAWDNRSPGEMAVWLVRGE